MAETFTPLFDEITQKHGIITSAVYGYIWRKCQGERGVCDASLQTIADSLGISRRTIVTHVKLLVDDGLITDLTPKADRKPHKYSVQTREIDALDTNADNSLDSKQLGKEMHQTREIDAHKDTILKNNTHTAREEVPADTPPIHSGFAYEHPPTGKALEYQHQIDEMAAALSTVTGMNLGLNKDKLEGEAIALLENKYTPEQVTAAFYGPGSFWRVMCYGGKKGDAPKFGNIRSEIARAVKWDGKIPLEPSTNGNGRSQHNQTTPPPIHKQPTQAEIDALQAMISRGLA